MTTGVLYLTLLLQNKDTKISPPRPPWDKLITTLILVASLRCKPLGLRGFMIPFIRRFNQKFENKNDTQLKGYTVSLNTKSKLFSVKRANLSNVSGQIEVILFSGWKRVLWQALHPRDRKFVQIRKVMTAVRGPARIFRALPVRTMPT